MVIIGNDTDKINQIKEKLKVVLKMKDLSEPTLFLGMQLKRDKKTRTLKIGQSVYVEKILETCNMKDCKPQIHLWRQVEFKKEKSRKP